MEWYSAIALLFALIIGMMLLGMPVAIAFLASNIIGAYIFIGGEIDQARIESRGHFGLICKCKHNKIRH